MEGIERALKLFTLIEKLAGYGAKYSNIRTAAFAELDEINSPAAPMPEPNPEPKHEPETTNRRR